MWMRAASSQHEQLSYRARVSVRQTACTARAVDCVLISPQAYHYQPSVSLWLPTYYAQGCLLGWMTMHWSHLFLCSCYHKRDWTGCPLPNKMPVPAEEINVTLDVTCKRNDNNVGVKLCALVSLGYL